MLRSHGFCHKQAKPELLYLGLSLEPLVEGGLCLLPGGEDTTLKATAGCCLGLCGFGWYAVSLQMGLGLECHSLVLIRRERESDLGALLLTWPAGSCEAPSLSGKGDWEVRNQGECARTLSMKGRAEHRELGISAPVGIALSRAGFMEMETNVQASQPGDLCLPG